MEAFTLRKGFFVFGREVYPQEVVAQVIPSVKSSLYLRRGLFPYN